MGITARVSLARARDVTLGTFLERFAHARANRVLVEQPDGLRLTYAEAADLVARAAGTVRTKITTGDRVVVALPNGYPLLLACLAVCRAGGVAVPVNERMAAPEIDYIEQDANAVWRIDDFDVLVDSPPTDAVPVSAEAVAMLLYTSGTTGRPKGAQLTHRSLLSGMRAGALAPEALLAHGCVTGMPVAHIAGLQMLLGLAAAGIPVFLLTHFRPTDALDAIEQRRPMLFLGVPAMYRMMLEAGAADRDLSSVRMWSSGADTLPPDIVDAFQRMGRGIPVPFTRLGIGRASFVDGYGMVELAGGVAVRVFGPIPIPGVRGLLRPMQGHEVRIVDDDGHDVGRGEVGELLVRGPGVMRGYYGRDDATAATVSGDGWLRTGDLARPRHLGFFELAGRKKDVIKHGGYSVFAVEVERALEEHPAVAEAAVLPLPDTAKGEVPVAAVRLHPDAVATPETLRAHCAAILSDYKVPRQIVVVDELPRTGTEKVQKRDLVPLFDAQ
ncbi:MAG TPA: AMP-binding protein [Acidimicrobiia bacterium]|nr:AMP-binding protein [Acidimicrobiia bacterium]